MATNPSATITNDTHVHAAKAFIASLDNAEDPVFAFAGKATPWGNVENSREIPQTVSNSYSHTIDAVKNLIFAKPISSSDAHLALKRNDWKSGEVYTQWSINHNKIYEMPYVTVLDSDGNCHVFMCISNNYGAQSTVKPDIIKSFTLQHTSDQYIWRWMFDIDKNLVDEWGCDHFLPMPTGNELSGAFIKEQSNYITIDYQAHILNIIVTHGGLFTSRVNLTSDNMDYLDPSDIFSFNVPDNQNMRLNMYAKHVIDENSGFVKVNIIQEKKIDYLEVIEDPVTNEQTTITHYIQESVQVGTVGKVDENNQPVLDSQGNQIMIPVYESRDKIFDIPIYHYTISKIEILSGGENISNIEFTFSSLGPENDDFYFRMLQKPRFDIVVDPKFVLGRDPAADIGARFVTTKLKFRDTENMMFPVSIHYRQIGLIKNLRYKHLTKDMISKYRETYGTQIPDTELPRILKIKEAVSFFDIVELDGVDSNAPFFNQTFIESSSTGIGGYILYASDVENNRQTLYIGSVIPNEITNNDSFDNRESIESYSYDNNNYRTNISAQGYVVSHKKHNISQVMGNVLYIENASNISRVSRQTEIFLLTFEL